MTRGLATAGFVVVLAFTLVGQAFAVSGERDNDAALRAMMDDAPHRPAKAPASRTEAPKATAPVAPPAAPAPDAAPAPAAPHDDQKAAEDAAAPAEDPQAEAPADPAPASEETAAEEETAPQAEGEVSAEAPAEAAEAPAEAEAAAKEAPSEGSWLSRMLPSVFGGGESAKTEAPAEGAAEGAAPSEEAAPAGAAAEHSEAAAEASHEAPAGESEASSEAPAADGHEASAGPGTHAAEGGEPAAQADAAAEPEAQKDAESGGGWMSYIPFFGSSSKTAEAPAADKPAEGGEAHEAKPEVSEGEHAAAEGEAPAAGGEHAADAAAAPAAEGEEAHGDATAEGHETKAAEKPAEESSGGWMSYIPFLGGGSKPDPAAKHAEAGKGEAPADGHGGEAKDGKPAEGGHGDAPAEGHAAEASAEGHAAEGEGHGEAAQAEGEHGDGPPPPPPMWPDKPAVEDSKQPFVRVRQLRRIQDQVAKGSIAAYDQQKSMMRDLGEEFRALPPEVWDDTRNVRAAVYYVLTGGDPRVLFAMLERETPVYVPRRLIRGALAYGEGRTVDAKASLDKVDPDLLAPELQGLVALIRGTLLAKNEPKKAVEFFDKARLFAPGTLVEESALRQQILLEASAGNMERFDFLSSAYARRFPRSLFARNFRRQLFAGIAKQVFKGEDQWIARTQTEMQRLPPGERAGLYLSIAEEATKGGHIKIAKFAAAEAAKLYPQGSKELDRARLYEGAVLVATVERDRGIELLGLVRPVVLKPGDRELYDAAQLVASSGRPRTVTPRDQGNEELPPAVVKAADLLKSTEALLTEESQ